LTISSYTQPGHVYRYQVNEQSLQLYEENQPHFNAENYTTTRVDYPSKDGTSIGMFLVHHKDAVLHGRNPTLLVGHGGFNVAQTPTFSAAHMLWLKQGGVLAMPNLRGGGEYGTAWHQAGTVGNKQQVVDDFIAAAEFLVEEGYTRAEYLAASGHQHGATVLAAALTQRPQLFAVALPDAGIFDMLRYQHGSSAARTWQDEFGVSTDSNAFTHLHEMSPLHNVTEGECYPATLITTGEQDEQVVPWHSYKLTARLQHAQGCDNPILLRTQRDAGDGSGSPVWMQITQASQRLAFALYQMQQAFAEPVQINTSRE
jgi:prolyl oligopeptidase